MFNVGDVVIRNVYLKDVVKRQRGVVLAVGRTSLSVYIKVKLLGLNYDRESIWYPIDEWNRTQEVVDGETGKIRIQQDPVKG